LHGHTPNGASPYTPGNSCPKDTDGPSDPTPEMLHRSHLRGTALFRAYSTEHPPAYTPQNSRTVRGISDRPRSLPKDGLRGRFLYLGGCIPRRSRGGLSPPLPLENPMSAPPPTVGHAWLELPHGHGHFEHLFGCLYHCHPRVDGHHTSESSNDVTTPL
jgi:hypothetical protein